MLQSIRAHLAKICSDLVTTEPEMKAKKQKEK